MKIIITGGAGFIGTHLARSLLKKGNSVTIFDNFSNSQVNTLTTLDNMGAKIIEGDITKLHEIVTASKDHDVVIHLAAKISVEDSIKNPSETFHVNVDGTKNVLNAATKNNIKKLIAASSAAVYGEGSPNVKLSELTKINPISPYGESKVAMEKEIKNFILKFEADCIILRFFNIYGIGQTSEYAGVVTKFIKKISINEPLEIFGDGTQTRDFVSIHDVVNSIHKAIEYRKSGIFNIASGKSTTIKELADFMISLAGKDLTLQYLPAKKGDIKYSQADISLAKKELQYSPKFGLDGIKNLFER